MEDYAPKCRVLKMAIDPEADIKRPFPIALPSMVFRQARYDAWMKGLKRRGFIRIGDTTAMAPSGEGVRLEEYYYDSGSINQVFLLENAVNSFLDYYAKKARRQR